MYIQKLYRSILFPIFLKRDGYLHVNDYLKKISRSVCQPSQNVIDSQFVKVKKLLNFSYEKNIYYKNLLDNIGCHPSDINCLEDYRRIPELTKNNIAGNSECLISNNFDKSDLIKSSSGGTTGFITEFYTTKESVSTKISSVLYYDEKAGWEYGNWMSLVWPATLDHPERLTLKGKIKNNLYTRRVSLYATVLNEPLLDAHFKQILKYKVNFIRAFPSPLISLAKYINSKSIELPKFNGIVTTGEILHDCDRLFLGKVFNCPIYNSYRTREVGLIAQECEYHNGLHVNVENIYVETQQLVDGRKQLIVTDLTNFAMPFIRYQIGDVGDILYEPCACGLNTPRIIDLGGRISDVTYRPDGVPVTSITLMPNVVHASGTKGKVQITQSDFRNFEILIEGNREKSEVENIQVENMKKIYGHEINVTHRYVERIPLLKSGKYQFVICKIQKSDAGKG